MIISLSEGFGGGPAGAASPFVSCSSASLLPDVGALRVIAGPWWRSRLCMCTRVHTHTYHTLTSHTCMLKWKRSHVDMHTHACTLTLTPIHTHTHTSPPLPTCRCAPLRVRHALHSSLLAGPCVPLFGCSHLVNEAPSS